MLQRVSVRGGTRRHAAHEGSGLGDLRAPGAGHAHVHLLRYGMALLRCRRVTLGHWVTLRYLTRVLLKTTGMW
jgi:hypothetical protein